MRARRLRSKGVGSCAAFCREGLSAVNASRDVAFSAADAALLPFFRARCGGRLRVVVRTSSRNFAVLLFDEVELLDVASLMQVTSSAGQRYNYRPFRLLPTARAPGLIETRSQLRIEAKHSLESCPPPELLFVPGGYGARRAAADADLIAFCQRVAPSAELIVAVGAGMALLGAAGLLDGATVAANAELVKWLAPGLPSTRFDERESVVASLGGKLLTAASSGCGVELGLAVVARCLGERTASALRASLGAPSVARLEPSPVTLTLPSR